MAEEIKLQWPQDAAPLTNEKVLNSTRIMAADSRDEDKMVFVTVDQLANKAAEKVQVDGGAIPAIQGGSTPEIAVALPNLSAGTNKYFDASAGYWKYNNVVLVNPNGVEGIPVGSEGVLFWDGTALKWAISKVQLLATMPIDGKIEEGNLGAVSGGDIFEYLSNKDNSLYLENSIFNSTQSNTITPNSSYNIYILNVDKDNIVDISSYFGNTAGSEFGFIAFSKDGKTVDSWLYLSNSTIQYSTQTVTAPDNGYIFVNVRKGESLPFLTVIKNDEFIYKSQIAKSFDISDDNKPASSRLTSALNIKIEILDLKTEIITPSNTATGNLGAPYKFASFQNKVFTGKQIQKIGVIINTAGTFSVMKIANRGSSTVEVLEKQVFNTVVGLNILELTENIVIDSNSDLAFLDLTDTATIKYRTGLGGNPVGGAVNVLYTTSGNWSVINNDLNIEVTAQYSGLLSSFTDESSPLKDVTFDILGDSVSTFAGYIPTGNSNYYPRASDPEIIRYDQTWWGRLMVNDQSVLGINNSSSGSIVAKSQGALSFYTRVENLSLDPNFIFLFGGTNDWLNSIPLGSSDLSLPIDDTTFTGCFKYVLEYILRNHKKSRLLVMLPMQRRTSTDAWPSKNSAGVVIQEYIDRIKKICDWYGVEYIRTDFVQTNFNWDNYTNEGTHPKLKGMEVIYKYVKNAMLKYL